MLSNMSHKIKKINFAIYSLQEIVEKKENLLQNINIDKGEKKQSGFRPPITVSTISVCNKRGGGKYG